MRYSEIQKLQELITNSYGWKIENDRRLLSISYNLFVGNYADLKKLLDDFKKPEIAIPIWDVRNRDELERFQNEVIRYLHNYLAAVKSLVDHTRIFAQKLYESTDFWNEYQARVNDIFVTSPFVSFVQNLRNYILHRGIPFTIASLYWEQDRNIDSSIMLDAAELRKWEKWPSQARDYIDSVSDEIKLCEIVHEYYLLVLAFYGWLEERQFVLHESEFNELKNLQKRMQSLLKAKDFSER